MDATLALVKVYNFLYLGADEPRLILLAVDLVPLFVDVVLIATILLSGHVVGAGAPLGAPVAQSELVCDLAVLVVHITVKIHFHG